ncbi:DNA recombination and repair protein Rad51-like, C-terminal [Dillenia turbinata]|uniref:DNA recombination and repair protein Rad51-like, C-terminal n=1 Tax=Dillenia turbinata TaxID=194707 RepID=A0AAN8VUD0_9MAGN
MGLLKHLERDFPIIDSDFQRFCASHGILSDCFDFTQFHLILALAIYPHAVEDFLFHDLYVLAAFAEAQSTSERLKQGITQVLTIIDGQHQTWFNGMELLENHQRRKRVLRTGCVGLDLLLEGGLCQGQLTELVGPSSSGKTQVCLQAASNVAKDIGGVVFIDTGNSVSPKRIVHLVNNILDPTPGEAKNRMFERIMRCILCHSVFNIFSLFNVLHELEANLRLQSEEARVQLIIIDSISSLITPILGSGSHGHALMISVGILLKKLANEYDIAVLVTNHMVGRDGGTLKPALGDSWKSIPNVRLLLSRVSGDNKCSMSIIKHPSVCARKQKMR